MANIMSMVKLQNKPSRNGFDLSRKVAFSGKIGELIPIECIECIPGDNFKVRKQHFTRTLPVNTAAYTRIREYYDWFFVPTNLLWNKFNTFVTQMTDNNQKAQSISEDSSVGTQHPYFTSLGIIEYLYKFQDEKADYRKNFFGYDRPMLTAKLLDYLGYGPYYGAGTPIDPGSPYPDANRTDADVLNPFPLLAYQKIYSDYFRNSQWEKAYSPAFNIDYMIDRDNLELPLSDIDYAAENMFDLRYCNWNKDYFMGVLPNSQYGDEAAVDLSSLVSYNANTVASGISLMANNANADVTTNANKLVVAGTSSVLQLNRVDRLASAMGLTPDRLTSAFTILALRQAEAAQKWREITQSAQQDYKSQVEAHFGVNVSDAYSDRCKFIDGQVNTIDINEVVNQSFGSDNNIEATIKGKGVGTGDGYFNFETKVHGYLMCIYHAVPLLDYQITGIKRQNLKSYVTDYAIPEFDKTGMIKMPNIELSSIPADSEVPHDGLIGYAPQYYDYKIRFDEIKGAFAYGGLTHWVAPLNDSYISQYFISLYEAFQSTDIEYHFFKVNPNVMNPIFVDQLDPDEVSSSELSSDQLLINCAFDIKAVRNLDRNGLPY